MFGVFMMLAKCVKCGKEYQLESNETPSNFQCECGGELSSKESSETVKNNTPKKKNKTWSEQTTGAKIGGILILFCIGVIILVGISAFLSPEKNTTSQNTSSQTSGVLTNEDVKSILGGDSRIKNIAVQNGVVTINYELGFVNDNNDIILKTSEDAIGMMQKLFKDSRVTSVTVVSSGTFTDQYGKDINHDAVQIMINKGTANKIDWNGVNDRLSSDPADLLKISNSYSINPSVYNKITISIPISK